MSSQGEKPIYEVAFEQDAPQKVHSSYIWLRPILVTLVIIVAGLGSSLDDIIRGVRTASDSGMDDWMIVVIAIVGSIVLVYVVSLVISVLSYKNISYEFGQTEFSLHTGIIFKKHQHVPYARVQSVNHSASFIQRIAGVCTVKIDTAGGAANKSIRVPFVTLAAAEGIRNDLFVRKAVAANPGAAVLVHSLGSKDVAMPQRPGAQQPAVGPRDQAANAYDQVNEAARSWRGVFAGTHAAEEPIVYQAQLTGKELALTSLSHSTAALTGVILGVCGFFSTGAAFIGTLVADAVGRWLAAGILVPIAIGIAIAAVLVGWALGSISTAITFGGFRVLRRGNHIEVEHGLLRHTFSGIDVDRIQSVVVSQSLIRRLIGYCEVSLARVDTANSSSTDNSAKLEKNGIVVHPFVRVDEVDALLAQLLPEFSQRPSENLMSTLPKVSQRRAMLRQGVLFNAAFWIALCCIAAHLILANGYAVLPDEVAAFSNTFFGIAYVVCAFCTVLSLFGARLWFKGTRYAWNYGFVHLYNDGLSTSRIITPRSKIQAGLTRTNPFQARSHVTTLCLTTAAGVSRTRTLLRDIREEDGAAWLKWNEPRR